ncbi:hypothetical protein R3P38DRAFT_3384828 [Favolaschia claudopus]|uniref:NADH dehydrogenase subunit 6 n=1 Tax=Favolaschia claudopus TaxID=2862362 RepID=A0AAW0DWY9_9AGAR
MHITFRMFRKTLLGLILLVSTASLVLSVYLKSSFIRPDSVYVLLGILGTLTLAAVVSTLKKPQLVATEVLGLFALFPFALILLLYCLTIPVLPDDPTASSTLVILQTLIFISTILHGLYMIGLVATAMLTVCAFDRDVWTRDMDSSPSPFPMCLLLGFISPCCRRPDSTFSDDSPEHPSLVCLPGCNCHKTPLSSDTERNPEMQSIASAGSSSRSLVRVPNDVERRTSIVVAFEEVL